MKASLETKTVLTGVLMVKQKTDEALAVLAEEEVKQSTSDALALPEEDVK